MQNGLLRAADQGLKVEAAVVGVADQISKRLADKPKRRDGEEGQADAA